MLISNFKKLSLIALTLSIGVILTGCLGAPSSNKQNLTDGGVYKSLNQGLSWTQKTLIPTVTGQARSFAGVNMASMAIDPSDNKALYFGSIDNGLLYTYDSGETWQIANSLGKITVRSIAVDPAYKCTIFASSGNKLYKSLDCCRTWEQAYFDNDLMVTIDALAQDQAHPETIYIGVSRGDVIKSTNRGEEWQTVYRVNDRIKKIVIDPNDSNKIYIVTTKKGIHFSIDGGATFSESKSIKESLNTFKIESDIKDLVLVKNNPGLMFVATANGMLKSTDSGATSTKVELIPDTKATVNTIAVNDKDINDIYYVTNTTFYHSIDGGATWKTSKLPTTRGGWKLLIDPLDAKILYLGVSNVVK